MNQIELIEGSTRDFGKSQFFTPPKLAQRLVKWALGGHDDDSWHRSDRTRGPWRVLEPSAGNGAIVRPLVAAGAVVTAFEIDTRYQEDLEAVMRDTPGCWGIANFLELTPVVQYDLACGNFPFHEDLAGEFTLHALEFAPRVCAIYPSNFFYSETREALWTQVRPTRIAHIAKRPWPGATDYVALELAKRREVYEVDTRVTVEWWFDSWS